jgi:hypothetical protein
VRLRGPAGGETPDAGDDERASLAPLREPEARQPNKASSMRPKPKLGRADF